MSIKYASLGFLKFILAMVLLSVSSVAAAKEINLYDQPSANAKVVGTVDLAAGITPIYSPPNQKEWIKIADPRNGNVGWVKTSELSVPGVSQSIFSFSQSTDSKSPPTVSVMQFGQSKNLTKEQADTIKKLQARQLEMQKALQNMVKQMDPNFFHDFPSTIPSFIMPLPQNTAQPTPAAAQPTVPATTTTTTTTIPSTNNMKQ